MRTLSLRVDDIVWSNPKATVAAPTNFSWSAFGWDFKQYDPTNRIEMTGVGEPRIELDHTYIMAIEWAEARCPGTDDQTPAQWLGLAARAWLADQGYAAVPRALPKP